MLTDNKRSLDDKMFRALLKRTNKISLQQNFLKAVLSTCDNPQNLPHLPVPKLEDTLNKYLNSVKPLLNEQEFYKTQKVVKHFGGCDGKKLQNYLLDKAECSTNWLEEWWLNTAYLNFRNPVIVYSSPGQALPFQNFQCEENRLQYAAKLIVATGSYKMLIDSKKIPVEKMGKDELDMNQYNKIFGTCRIPGLPADKLEFHGDSKHIVIARNNHFFKVNLFEDCHLVSEAQMLNQLKRIMIEASKITCPVGILTSNQRDAWANAYQTLVCQNEKPIRTIQQSLFLVCLDNCMPNMNCNRETEAAHQFIHGGGSQNAGNRWYDKTLQFVLGEDGIIGLTYEHSPSEGQPIAVMVDYLVDFITKKKGKSIPNSPLITPPKQLRFDVSDETKCDIDLATKNIDKLAGNLDLNCFKFDKYGKEFIKSQKLSPDSYIQMAIQLAFYRLHGEPGAHYESAATRKFVGGRTETIRSCSTESVKFAKAMLDPQVPNIEKFGALREAVNGHKKYTVEALNGQGVDRHLLGMKLAAKELRLKIPDLYTDAGYTRSTHMRISTSQVATKCDGLMSYGPLVEDGYGCCYNPRNQDINFAISAFEHHPDTKASCFKKALEQSLIEMECILRKTQPAKL